MRPCLTQLLDSLSWGAAASRHIYTDARTSGNNEWNLHPLGGEFGKMDGQELLWQRTATSLPGIQPDVVGQCDEITGMNPCVNLHYILKIISVWETNITLCFAFRMTDFEQNPFVYFVYKWKSRAQKKAPVQSPFLCWDEKAGKRCLYWPARPLPLLYARLRSQ